MQNLNSYIDHTNLKPDAAAAEIEKLCTEARQYGFAAVCIHPCRIPLAKRLLAGSDVRVATVIGFPLGACSTAVKAFETRDAIAHGCDEIDMVINIGEMKDGNTDYVLRDIQAVVEAAQSHPVKVIIETCLLTDDEKRTAVQLSCRAGAAFVKTSTGFSKAGATADDVALMKAECTEGVLVKAAGGIRTRADALKMIEAGADRLGCSAGVRIMEDSL